MNHKNLPPEIRQRFLTFADQKAMEPTLKKRNQAIADLNAYLVSKRRPQDERERQKLLRRMA